VRAILRRLLATCAAHAALLNGRESPTNRPIWQAEPLDGLDNSRAAVGYHSQLPVGPQSATNLHVSVGWDMRFR
jgi:hypothetical protein